MVRNNSASMTALVLVVMTVGLLSQQVRAQEAGGGTVAASQAPAPAAPRNARPSIVAWVFKPKLAPYTEPNRPVWHIADILARNKGKTDWVQTVVKDQWFLTQYISMGPAGKTPTRFESDTLSWFIVQAGQIRFTIKGQEPFVAGKDFIVQVPMRTPYSMETVGDVPSLRLEVHTADAATVFPVADNPEPPKAPPGYETVKVEFTSPSQGSSSNSIKPYLDFDKDVVNNPNPAPRVAGEPNFFVKDAHGFAVPIRGPGVALPPDTNIGHFHLGLAEWWFVLEGDMDVKIEGLPAIVEAHQGDVVYAPTGRYHRTTLVGKPMSTRVAMGGVTDSGAILTPYTGGSN